MQPLCTDVINYIQHGWRPDSYSFSLFILQSLSRGSGRPSENLHLEDSRSPTHGLLEPPQASQDVLAAKGSREVYNHLHLEGAGGDCAQLWHTAS
jgi:hypothetical protein